MTPLQQFFVIYGTGKGKQLSKSRPVSEIMDKYAKYFQVKNMTTEFANGELSTGVTQVTDGVFVDFERVHQEIFDVNMLFQAQELGLYKKVGADHFELTQRGKLITEQRQLMTAAEVRALVRKAINESNIGLTAITEEERTPTEQDTLS